MVVQPLRGILPVSLQRQVDGVRLAGAEPALEPPVQPKDLGLAPGRDTLALSDKAGQAFEAAHRKTPLPRFGRFQLGGPEPLAFGPDQFASALTKIPGDGYRTPAEGVDLGHQPVRGLNLLG